MAELNGLAAWRRARGRVGLQPLPEALPEDCPFTLTVDFSGLTELASSGRMPNPLIESALKGLDHAQEEMQAAQQQPEGTRGNVYYATSLRLQETLDQWHDAVLSAFIVEPPYYRLDALPRGGCPEDGICLFDIPPDRRQALVNLAVGGYETLDSFRATIGGAAAGPDGGEVGAAAESVAAAPDTPPGVSPRPGALHPVDPPGRPDGGRSRGSAPDPQPRSQRRTG